jgi:hypothetical protein
MRGRKVPNLDRGGKSREERRSVQSAEEGLGPLLQRDYLGIIEGGKYSPEGVLDMVRGRFAEFSPSELAEFTRPDGASHPLRPGDTMHVFMPGAGHAAVVVSLLDPRTFTLRTLEGHLEAGRITFGAERDAAGRLVFRIRSRSTISDLARLIAYRLLGIHVQTRNPHLDDFRGARGASGGRTAGGRGGHLHRQGVARSRRPRRGRRAHLRGEPRLIQRRLP